MRIYSLTKVLALPLVIIFVYILYLAKDNPYSEKTWLLIIPTVLLTALYVFHGQINYWYLKRNPPPLDKPIVEWLTKYSRYYNSLGGDRKKLYEERLALYLEAREFTSIGVEKRGVPDDIKGIIGSIPVMMTMNDEDFLLGDYDRVFLYKHPFPSPEMKFLHTVETDHEDGVLIFSMEHLIPPLVNARQMYNIGCHGYAVAYLQQYPTKSILDVTESHIPNLEKISGFSMERVEEILGYKLTDLRPMAINYYFTFPVDMKSVTPDLYQKLDAIFGLHV